MRCGDHVYHKPSDQTWLVAYADTESGYMAWSGWPEGRAPIADCKLVYACTDKEHAQAVSDWLDKGNASNDHRRRAVQRLYRPDLGPEVTDGGGDADT